MNEILPKEIVDIIYLKTNFITAITQIPNNKYVVGKLFDKEFSVIKKNEKNLYSGMNKIGNRDTVFINKLLTSGSRRALEYFRERRPFTKITYAMFKYNEDCEIDDQLPWNSLLISVFKIDYEQIMYYNKMYKSTKLYRHFSP